MTSEVNWNEAIELALTTTKNTFSEIIEYEVISRSIVSTCEHGCKYVVLLNIHGKP